MEAENRNNEPNTLPGTAMSLMQLPELQTQKESQADASSKAILNNQQCYTERWSLLHTVYLEVLKMSFSKTDTAAHAYNPSMRKEDAGMDYMKHNMIHMVQTRIIAANSLHQVGREHVNHILLVAL